MRFHQSPPKPPTSGLRLAVTTVAGFLAVLAIGVAAPISGSASAGPASARTTPYLPEPSGPRPVGTTTLYLEDRARPDPWVPEAKTRELMVSLWYPTDARTGDRAQYVTPKESQLILAGTGLVDVPPDSLSRTRTNAFRDAEPAGDPHSLPLVVLSPGFTWPRSSLTALAEELASRGYAVVGVDHTYETFATTFPDGRVTTCAACAIESGDNFGERAVRSRAIDISFVLDQLTGPQPTWKGSRLIDPTRIAMAGSSLGGASAAETMLSDVRVRAGINMDGTMFAPIPQGVLSRPFLFLGEQAFHSPGGDETWDRDWAALAGWKRWLVVAGSVHASFTDYDLLAAQLGVDLGSELAGSRSVDITRTYVRAFFDLHLRRKPQPLLERTSPRYPEVRFCAPPATTCG